LRDGFLKKCDEADALLSLLSIMALTPKGSWSGCVGFGLRDAMGRAKGHPEKLQHVLEELNSVLSALGIVDFRVESINRESIEGGIEQWMISLVSTVARANTHSLQWRAQAG
jgi:hypothetical protein